MSNTSIAAYPTARGKECLDLIGAQHPEWRVVLNPRKFVADVNVMVMENERAMLVWLVYPQYEDWKLYKELAAQFECGWMQVFFQAHIAWEYNLHDAQEQIIDRFQTLPSMWGHETGPVGNAEVVAGRWSIPPANIQRYLKPWNERLRRRKAYWCRDEFRYGQYEQGHDFLRAVTGLSFPGA